MNKLKKDARRGSKMSLKILKALSKTNEVE